MIEFSNIQGNSLIPFGRAYEVIIFWQFDSTTACREWTASIRPLVTSCEDQLTHFKKGLLQSDEPPIWLSLGFTLNGLSHVLPDVMRGTKPQMARWLNEDGFANAEDRLLPKGICDLASAVTILGSDSSANLDHAIDKLIKHAISLGVIPLVIRRGDYKDSSFAYENFGFRDGISNPQVLGVPSRKNSKEVQRYGVKPGEFILGYPNEASMNGHPIADWMKDGTFLAYARLRQNAGAFERLTSTLARAVRSVGLSNVNSEYAAAMLMGRWKDGTPVDARQVNGKWEGDEEHYNYGVPGDNAVSDTILCPFIAHTFRANPRNLTGEGVAGQKRHKIIRRGRSFEDEETNERGLLFICYQASIIEQFDWILRRWCLSDQFPIADAGLDGILGGLLGEGGQQVVTATESGYFFIPSLKTLAFIG